MNGKEEIIRGRKIIIKREGDFRGYLNKAIDVETGHSYIDYFKQDAIDGLFRKLRRERYIDE